VKTLISGAGISGLTLGWWLARDGWDVRIVERANGPRSGGYMIDFFGPGYDVAERMGIIGRLEQLRYHVPGLVCVDDDGLVSARLDYELFRRMLNDRALNFMRGDLECVLHEVLPSSVTLRFGCSIERIDVEPEGVEYWLSDGSHETVDLLIGADGIHSRVRQLAFGEESGYLRSLGYQTAAYVFQDDRIRRELGGDFRAVNAPGKQAAFYPIRDEGIASFYVYESSSAPPQASACDELVRTFGDMRWVVPAALQQCRAASDVYFDQVAQVVMKRWSRGRVALIGDACLAVSLLAGQGASMGMASAYVLARELRSSPDIEEAMRAYEGRLRSAVEKAQASGRGTAKFMVPSSAIGIALRNTAIRAVGRPPLSWILDWWNPFRAPEGLIVD
jgi:2-polyprenyl-6-methoxyphenol hydroxylase-like FAD-dependent oxidoreductase